MFTGIITNRGTILDIEIMDAGKRFSIASAYDLTTIDIGASIAHNGVCMTVVEKAETGENFYKVEAWEEALRLTTMDSWQIGDQINLERSLKIGDELGGHLVSGHVDGLATVMEVKDEGQARRFTLSVAEDFAKFIAPKGSLTLDGTSLTVNRVEGSKFDVLLIRHTMEVTGWGQVVSGDKLNLEIDQMARYAARLAQFT